MKLFLAFLIITSISFADKTSKKSVVRKVAQETTFTPLLAEDSDTEEFDTSAGTSLVGFHNNAETTPLLDLIKQAGKSIDIEIYEMYDKAIVQALTDAIDRGVRLRLIKDPQPVGGDKCFLFTKPSKKSKKIAKIARSRKLAQDSETDVTDISEDGSDPTTSEICKLQRSLKEKALANGGAFIGFNRPTLCGKNEYDRAQCVQHGKLAIIDGGRALVSTGNFNSSSLCDLKEDPSKCNRDYSYVTRDPEVIALFTNIFESDLAQKRYDIAATIATSSTIYKATVSPYSLLPLMAFVNKAQKTLQIQNQYMKDSDLNNAIKQAAKRGVKVTIQIANLLEFSKSKKLKPKDVKKFCTLFGDLKKNGIEVLVFPPEILINKKPGYLHAKVMVIDADDAVNAKAWVGSVNGSSAALNMNREFGIFFNHPERVKHLTKVMNADFAAGVGWEKQVTCDL